MNRSMSNSSDTGHASKRQRTDTDGHGVQSGSVDRFDDPHKPSPSPVVHVRNLGGRQGNIDIEAIDRDIWDACERFGKVADVMVMPKKKQALVEFEALDDAINLVKHSQDATVYISSQPAYFNFSTSSRIKRPSGPDGERDRTTLAGPNHVLLFTILDPMYPITVDVMKTICSSFGKVLRIVIFRKFSLQSMVEFDSVESAKAARANLQGADIYTNCCTLRVEYAKTNKVNVRRNDPAEGWDFTVTAEQERTPPRTRPSLLPDPRSGFAGESTPRTFETNGSYRGYESPQSGFREPSRELFRDEPRRTLRDESFNDYSRGRTSGFEKSLHDFPPARSLDNGSSFNGRFDRGSTMSSFDRGSQSTFDRGIRGDTLYRDNNRSMSRDQGGCVLMIYGLNKDEMNCQKLFNLLCLYGNVIRIKFLMKKEGSAMVEMGDSMAVDRCMQNLNNTFFHGSKMQVSKSIQTSVQEVLNPQMLADNTPSYKDCARDRNNRYTNAKHAEKNRPVPPSSVLHFYNAPPNMTEEEHIELFKNQGADPPLKVKQFPSKSARSSSGLLLWEKECEAVQALARVNHHEIQNPTGHIPFIYKLCFSSNTNVD